MVCLLLVIPLFVSLFSHSMSQTKVDFPRSMPSHEQDKLLLFICLFVIAPPRHHCISSGGGEGWGIRGVGLNAKRRISTGTAFTEPKAMNQYETVIIITS